MENKGKKRSIRIELRGKTASLSAASLVQMRIYLHTNYVLL